MSYDEFGGTAQQNYTEVWNRSHLQESREQTKILAQIKNTLVFIAIVMGLIGLLICLGILSAVAA